MAASEKKTISKILRCILIIAVIYIILAFCATKIIYDRCFERYDPGESGALADASVHVFESEGNKLLAYLSEPDFSLKDALVVIAPGYRSLCSDYEPIIRNFNEKGYSVFIFDCTGNALSEGDSAVGFSQEIIDLDAALRYVEEKDYFGCSDVLLFGHSRGGLAVCCMERYGHDIAGIVSVNGINSTMEGVMLPAVGKVGDFAYANYPVLKLYQDIIFGTDIVSYDAADFLSSTDIPTLIIHSSDDETVPADRFSIMSHKEQVQSDNVVFIDDFKGSSDGSHTGVLFDSGREANGELCDTVSDFFEQALSDRQ